MQPNYTIKKRYVLRNLKCIGITDYETENIYGSSNRITLYRHVFVGDDKQMFIYKGKRLSVCIGDFADIRGTVARFYNRDNPPSVKLSRVQLLSTHEGRSIII